MSQPQPPRNLSLPRSFSATLPGVPGTLSTLLGADWSFEIVEYQAEHSEVVHLDERGNVDSNYF